MIGIDGQYILEFRIGRYRDFVQESQFESFKIIEDIGNLLPVFELKFTVESEEISRLINTGNPIRIEIGKHNKDTSELETQIIDLSIQKTMVAPNGIIGFSYILQGFIDKVQYVQNIKTKVYKDISGLDVVKQVAAEFFEVIDEVKIPKEIEEKKLPEGITTTFGKQNWVQNGISAKSFISKVLEKTYIPNTTIVANINSRGQFILRDLKTQSTMEPRIRFVPSRQQSNDIVYNSEDFAQSDQGFYEYLGSQGRDQITYNLSTGKYEVYSEEFKPILIDEEEILRNSKVTRRASQLSFLSDNVDEKTLYGYSKNLQSAGTLKQTGLALNFNNILEDIALLDLVWFQDISRSDNNSNSDRLRTGKYLVTKTAINLTKKTIYHTLRLSRETLNVEKEEAAQT